MPRLVIMALATMIGWLPQVPRDRGTMLDASGTSAIAGQIIIEVNGAPQPLRRTKVTIEGQGLARSQATYSDTQGRYRFDRLSAGTYRVRAEKAGFVPYVMDPRHAFQLPNEVDVLLGQTLSLDLRMVRGGAMEGRILKDTGDPAINAVVSAVRFSYEAAGRRGTAVHQARTDDRGKFRVHSLPAGEYYLEAASDPLDVSRQAPARGGRLTMLGRSFYPGAPRLEGGQSIALVEGQNVGGLDFSVPTVSATTVRGTVLDSTGAPARSMFACVQRVGGVVGEVRGSINPRGNDFSYPYVPPGEFWVMGIARPTPAADPEFAVARLTVTGETLPEIVLTTAKGAFVNGRVEVDNRAAPMPASLQVVAHETEYELPSLADSPIGPSLGVVAADGTFTFRSLFGPRLLRLETLPAGWGLMGVWLDGVDVTDVSVDFRGRETVRTIRVVITPRTGGVSGVVRNEAGQAVGDARVVVFSADDRSWGWRSRMVRSTESDDQGRYAINGLLEGEYNIIAVLFLEDGSWMDATILSRLVPNTSLVKVSGSEKQTANLVVKR
jgi:hypothetical protein